MNADEPRPRGFITAKKILDRLGAPINFHVCCKASGFAKRRPPRGV